MSRLDGSGDVLFLSRDGHGRLRLVVARNEDDARWLVARETRRTEASIDLARLPKLKDGEVREIDFDEA